MAEYADASAGDAIPPKSERHPVRWYRSTFYNMTILGLCNLAAPGIWGAMNSLGAGGAASPKVVNAANALTFCLMVVSCYFSSVIVHYIGIKGALIFGTIGYAPFAAGLYTNNRYGIEWLMLLGAALCGISAGVFWMAEAAIAIAYPEPWNRGKALGYWLTYRLCGQILGGAINLGLNADNDQAGKVSYTVFIIFIAIQAVGPFVGLFLNKPDKVERQDGQKVSLAILENPWHEIKATTRNLFTPKFLLIVLWIGQAVFAEAVFFTYLATWFSVRSRALGSFLSGIVAVISGNFTTALARSCQDLAQNAHPLYLLGSCCHPGRLVALGHHPCHALPPDAPNARLGQPGLRRRLCRLHLPHYRIPAQLPLPVRPLLRHRLAKGEEEVIRYAALLRGVESAWQAVSYGLTSVTLFGEVGAIYFNFALWAVAIGPAWLVLRHFGSGLKANVEEVREVNAVVSSEDGESDTKQH